MADENLNDLAPFWQEAVKAYERECEHRIELTPEEHPHNTGDLLALIEKKSGDFKSFRERHNTLWSRLKRIAEPIATTGDLLSTILGSSNPWGAPASIVLTSVLHLVSSCQGVTQAYDWIESILSDAELGDFCQRLHVYQQAPINNALKRKIVAILAFILRIIGRSELLIKRNRFREYLRVSFIGKDEKTHALVEDLNKLLTNEQRLVLALTYEKATDAVRLGTETKKTVEGVRDGVKQLTAAVEESVRSQADDRLIEKLQYTLKTAAAASTDDWYSGYRRRLLQGSGSWLQTEEFFDYWVQHRAPVLWIFGDPGSGKTMLSTWLISLLRERFEVKSETYPGTSVGYFFIKENVEELRNPNTIFKTMAWQISQTNSAFRNHVAKACELEHKVALAEDTWENLFLDYYQGPLSEGHHAILVIDGLDEARVDGQRRILRMIRNYVSSVRSGRPHRIQFAVFGRSTLRPELKRVKLDRDSEKIIEVSSAKNHQDMSNYITSRVKELDIVALMRQKKPGGPEKAKKFARSIRRKVLDGAGGVFLWAQLLLDQMEGKNESQISESLANPPLNLYDMIYSVFDRLSRDPEIEVETANRLLAWVAFAKRPLSFGEVDVILRLGSTQTNWFLWNHVRGKFSSVIRLRYPRSWNAEEVDGEDEEDEEEDDDNFSLGDSSEDHSEDESDDAENGEFEGSDEDTGPNHDEKQVSDADDLYSWAQKHTMVDFSHQHFRDFLVREGNPEERLKQQLPICIKVPSVELKLVTEGFQVLRAALDNEVYIENYVSYPAFHIFSHLAAVDDRVLDDVTRAHVLAEIYWLMHEESGCRTLFAALGGRENGECDAFWNMWLADKRTTSIIQHWFKNADGIQGISQNMKSWMRDASESVPLLLRPLAVTAAKLWLTKKGWGDTAYLDKSEFQIWFLKGYRAMNEQGKLPEEFSSWNWDRDGNFESMTADEIEDLAEWAQLPKTTHWYTGVGWTLSQTWESERAQYILGLAIDTDPDAWVAMEAMARSMGDDGEHEKAIVWMEKALEALSKTPNSFGVDSFLLSHIARWKQDLGDYGNALDTSKTAWYKNKASLPAVHSYVCALIQAEDWDELIEVLEYLSDYDNGYGSTYLVKYLSDYELPLQIGRACRARSQPGFVLDALEEALQLVEQSGNEARLVRKLMVFGELQYRFYDQDDTPVRLWEEALSRFSTGSSDLSQELAHAKFICTNLSAQVYFDIAVQNYRARAETNEAVMKLKQLATTTSIGLDGYEDVFSLYTPGYPSLLYGRWLRDYEKAQPSIWRKCFRARILEQMDGLSDDDPTNDTVACRALAISLFQAGDRENAGLVLAALFGTLGEHMTRKITVEHLKGEADGEKIRNQTVQLPAAHPDANELGGAAENGPLINVQELSAALSDTLERGGQESSLPLHLESNAWRYFCDGCKRDPEAAGTMFFCEVCYDVNFCAACLDKAKTLSLEERYCNPHHSWFQAWPIQENVQDMICHSPGGSPGLTREWLEALRREWLIE